MKNRCEDCGICCIETEMILSDQDIEAIVSSHKTTLRKTDFVQKTEDNFYQLKNINGHCFFFDGETKLCKIYEIRPQGCRFYPLIYDSDKNSCVFDIECPRPELFYPNKNTVRRTCKKILSFLENQVIFSKLR